MVRTRNSKLTNSRCIVIAALSIICSFFIINDTTTTSTYTSTFFASVDAASSKSAFECHSDYDCNLDDEASTTNGPIVKRYCRFVFDSDIKSASFCSYDPAEDTLYGSPFACQDDDECRYGYCHFIYSNSTETDPSSTTDTIARNENATDIALEEGWNNDDSEGMTSKRVSSHCICDAGFMGLNCQNRCTATCHNGGQCVAHYDNQGYNANPSSSHAPGSTFVNSATNDEMQANAALDKTTDSTPQFHIRCDCPFGYSGFLCEIDDFDEKKMSTEAKSMFSVSGVIVCIVAVVAFVLIQRRRRRNKQQQSEEKDRDSYNIQSRYTDDTDSANVQGKRSSLWDIPTVKTSMNSMDSSDTMPSPLGSVRVAITSMVSSVKDRLSSVASPTSSQTNNGSPRRASSLSISQVASSLAEARAKRTDNQNQRRMEREHVMASRAARRLAEQQNTDEEISFSSNVSNAFSSTSSSKHSSTSGTTRSSMSGATFAKSKASGTSSSSKPPKSRRSIDDKISSGITVLNAESKHYSSSNNLRSTDSTRSSSSSRNSSRTRGADDNKYNERSKENNNRRRSSSSTRSSPSPKMSAEKKSTRSSSTHKSDNKHTSTTSTAPSTSKFTEWSTSEDGFVVFNVNSKNNNNKSNDIV
jgi:hypothetical protein